MKKPSKKNVVAVLAGVTVATAVAASAASLGGLTTQWLGANSNVVSSPVTGGVNVTWDTDYDADLGYYVVTDFTLDTIDETETLPTGAEVQLTLQLADSATEEFEGTVTGDGTVDLGTVPAIAAHDVEGVSVVITGGGADSADRS